MASPEDIASFMSFTGANDTAAARMLEMCGNVEQAIQLWYADEDLQRTISNPAPTATATAGPSTARGGPSRRSRPPGREDAQGVIHIDSDDDDDVQMTEDEAFGFDDGDDTADAVNVARTAQEEEDAAMAKRLQEELYAGQAVDEEGVRAPLARTTEMLVAPAGGDDFDHDAAVMEQMMLRRRQAQARSAARNPFEQNIWEDPTRVAGGPATPASSIFPGAPGIAGGSRGRGQPAPSTRATRLAELFRPPFDLIQPYRWDEARDVGKESKKWILVNLQDMSDFNCQALNRDIWKDEAIRELVAENFIFLQFEKSDPASEQYRTFYFPGGSHENPNNYPHVSVVDPRTGEQVKVWSGIPFPDALDFHMQLVEFLDRYSLAANSKNPVVKAKRPERTVDVDRMTEDEMLQLAMQNSLDANGADNSPNLVDPDELTKSAHDVAEGKGKGRAEPEAEPAAAAAPEASAFSRIPSDQPHVEPAADPKTTTRIQVRNPPSRIIRRFRLDEPVARIFEWLKAEPLPGKEGVEFELKSMPQGNNLIESLDQTIAEAGLANGTVMIEFIED